MKELTFKLIIVLVVLVGTLFSLGVWIWQIITNMYGFWFWFSLQATMGWGFLIALLNDTNWIRANNK